MAKLPDATAFGERPEPQLPRRTPMVAGYRATSGFEGAGADTAAHVAGDMDRIADYAAIMKERADTLAAEDAYNKLRQKQLDLTYGPQGFLNLKGADVVNRDVPTAYGTQLRDAADGLSENLSNDYQKKLFAKRAAAAQLQMQQTAYHHVANESDRYAEQVLNGTVDTESRLASASGDVPTSQVRINAAIDRHAQRFGLPEEAVISMKLGAADKLWTSRIRTVMQSDPLAAQTIYKEHEAEIGPQNKAILEHEIHTNVLPLQAKLVSDYVLTGAQGPEIANLVKTLDVGGEAAIQKVSQEIQAQRAAAPQKVSDTRAMLGTWLADAERVANAIRPNDIAFRDMVTTQVKGYVTTIAAAQEGVQRQAQGLLLTAASGGPEGKGPKPQTLDALLAMPGARESYALLDASASLGIRQHLEANQREALGLATKSNVPLYFSLVKRMYSDGDDRITSFTQILPFMRADGTGLSPADSERLKADLAYAQTPEGRAFGVDRNKITTLATNMLLRSNLGQVYQDKALDAAKRFSDDLDKKIAEYRKAGKDPRDLFDSSKPDYVASPARVATFMPDVKQTVKDGAAQVRATMPPRDKMTVLDKADPDGAYDKLSPGTWFIGPDGSVGQKPPEGNAAPAAVGASAPKAKEPVYAQFVKRAGPRTSSITIDAPARSPASSLNGKTYASREEAMSALAAIYEGAK